MSEKMILLKKYVLRCTLPIVVPFLRGVTLIIRTQQNNSDTAYHIIIGTFPMQACNVICLRQ